MSNRLSVLPRRAESFSQPKVRSTVMTGLKLYTTMHRPKKGPGSYRRTNRAAIVGW